MNYDDYRNMGFISLEEISGTSSGFVVTNLETNTKNSTEISKKKILPHWKNFNLDSNILKFLLKEKYYQPTEIQQQVLQDKATRNPVNIISSPTGSGKTLSYLIPILNDMLSQKNLFGVNCIIISPTKDLALQVKDIIPKILGPKSYLKAVALCNGICQEKQERVLKRGFQILILTPGKLKEIFQSHYHLLNNIKYFVVDEADKLLDHSNSSYRDLMVSFKKLIKIEYSSLFFISSTLTKEFITSSGILPSDSKSPTQVKYFSNNLSTHQISDYIWYVLEKDKICLLLDILKRPQFKKVIIFSNLKSQLFFLNFLLKRFSFDNKVINSGSRLGKRNKFINKLPMLERMIILSTDLMARGMDLNNFDCVIQYSFPNNYEAFVHRRGRVGRQSSGENILFCTPIDNLKILENISRKIEAKPNYYYPTTESSELKNQLGAIEKEFFLNRAKDCKNKDL
jgi:ATP-dependent RNA helicase RhlE